jgi:hypothetical protein
MPRRRPLAAAGAALLPWRRRAVHLGRAGAGRPALARRTVRDPQRHLGAPHGRRQGRDPAVRNPSDAGRATTCSCCATSDSVPQIFGPVLIMPGQSFRLPFETVSVNEFACTAHASGQMRVVVDAMPGRRLVAPAWRALRGTFLQHELDVMEKLKKILPPLAVLIGALIALWWVVVVRTESVIFPTPLQVVTGTLELAEDGTLWEHIGASLFRVGTGFGLAACWSPCRWACGWAAWTAPTAPQSDLPDPAADLADRLDPAGDPVVRRRQPVADLPDLHRLRVPDDRADRGRRAHHRTALPATRRRTSASRARCCSAR